MSSSFFASYRKYKVFICSCWYAARGSQAVLSTCTIPVMGISRIPPTLQGSISFRTSCVRWSSSTERSSYYYSPIILSKFKYATSFHKRDSTISFPRKISHIIKGMKMSSETYGEKVYRSYYTMEELPLSLSSTIPSTLLLTHCPNLALQFTFRNYPLFYVQASNASHHHPFHLRRI